MLAGGFLLALAAPALQLHIASPGNDTLPKSLSAVGPTPEDREGVPAKPSTRATIMVRPTAHADAPAVTAALTDLERSGVGDTAVLGTRSRSITMPTARSRLLTIGNAGQRRRRQRRSRR